MKLWDDFLISLEKRFGKETISRWLKTVQISRYDAANLYLEAKDSFQAMWFEEHVRPLIKKNFVNNNGRPIKVHLSVLNNAEAKKTSQNKVAIEINRPPIAFVPDELNPYFTFEQYVSGDINLVPYQILCKLTGFNPHSQTYEVPSIESGSYNPIYLYGPSGTGKSHLLMATAIAYNLRGLKVFYVHAQTFTDHVVSAIRRSKMQEFRAAYRHVDVLIIDNIGTLSKKNATQEELFHTFNTLHTSGIQIILSSSLAPRFLEDIEERLISRFEWGITLPLEKIEGEKLLKRLLNLRSELHHLHLHSDLQQYLIQTFNDASSLSSAIESLLLHCHLENIDATQIISLTKVKDHLDQLKKQDLNQQLSSASILEVISSFFDINVEDITGKSQSRDCVLPRQIAMYLLRNELKMPFMKIGRVFSRDHSTVMTSIKNIAKSMENNQSEISGYVLDLKRRLSAKG